MRYARTIAVLLLVPTTPIVVSACTVVGCLGGGVEMRRNFIVQLSHDDKPLAGVAVEVTTNDTRVDRKFSGVSGADGTIRVSSLRPGNYWLKAELLGVVAGSECFHVEQRASRKAKDIVNYEWGGLAPSAKSISGKLVESVPGNGQNAFLNRLQRVDSPVPGAILTLINGSTLERYSASSDQSGTFLFDEPQLPDGTYVLHIEGGILQNGANREASNWVIKINKTVAKDRFLFRLGGPPGSCGGWSLE